MQIKRAARWGERRPVAASLPRQPALPPACVRESGRFAKRPYHGSLLSQAQRAGGAYLQFSGMCAVTAPFKGRIDSIRRNVCARASTDANSSREAGRPTFFSSRLRAPMLTFLVCRRVDIGHRMPLLEMEAIVLRTYRLGEADKIASLFT